MRPGAFIAKWRASELTERSAAQSHFIDLCNLLDEPTPTDADPAGERYTFERGARKDIHHALFLLASARNQADSVAEFVNGKSAKTLFPERKAVVFRRTSMFIALLLTVIVAWH